MELKPCPFCGGEAHFAVSSDGYAVECDGELCVRNAMQEHPSEEYAALWWNTRAQGTCQMTEIFCGTESGIEWVCSECGSTCFVSEPLDADEQPRYCPNCGAKVVEE